MIEKRKHKRFPATMELHVSSLFKQDNVQIQNINAPIEVIDISKSGIGFISEGRFPLHYYFNASITLGEGDDSTLYCVVEIIRSTPCPNKPNCTRYGCQFIGLANVFDYIFDDYEKSFNENN